MSLVTAFVPSDTACLARSPGRMRRTAVWISRLMGHRLQHLMTLAHRVLPGYSCCRKARSSYMQAHPWGKFVDDLCYDVNAQCCPNAAGNSRQTVIQ